MKTKHLVPILLVLSFTFSCGFRLDVDDKYIMTSGELRESLPQSKMNLVLFWTDWCGASKQRINEYYKPLSKIIEDNGIDLQLTLLASDQNISLDQIEELKEIGIPCYYIQKPGSNAILNRIAIKNFINQTFPENQFQKITKFQFGIPVELLIDSELNIINELNYAKSYNYVDKLMKKK